MKVDENTQLFLLLVWVITLSALIAALWLFRDIKQVSDRVSAPERPAPYVIPPSSAQKPANKFEIPPPPF